MIIENRLGFPSRERVAKAAAVTLVIAAPVAGIIARKELSLRRAKKEQQDFEEETRQDAIRLFQDNNNSGNSGFEFPQEK